MKRRTTFLLTDIEGSTALWERDVASMSRAVGRHDALLAEVVTRHGGTVVKSRGEGDSLFTVFDDPLAAVRSAIDGQLALAAEPWPTESAIAVRMAVHVGEADVRDGDFYGPAVNRCARLRGIASGGQVVLSLATAEAVRGRLPDGVTLRDLGPVRLRGLGPPEPAFEAVHPSLQQRPRPPAGVRVRVLGGLAVDAGGTELPLPAGRRSRALLGWLAIHPGMHSRSAVAGRFWPDVTESRARTSLRTALSEIRRALGAAGAEVLQAGPDEVGLAGNGALWVDVRAFQELVRADRLEEAVALCTGDLLASLDDEWVLEEREAHRARLCEVLGRLTATARAEGSQDRALRWARARAELDPLGEAAQRDLIRSLAETGDRPAAVLAYDRLRTRLREELGLTPSAETRTLAETLLDEQPQPAVASEVPPPALPPALAGGRQLSFVGRQAEMEALRELWVRSRGGQRRVVLLEGEPGIGKTRLGAEFCAHAHADGAAVLVGRCYEETLTPYQPFAEALTRYVATAPAEALLAQASQVGGEIARLVPDLGRRASSLPPPVAGDPEGERYRLFEAVVGLLGAIARTWPVVLLLEDLHWADPSTALLLAHVVRSSDELPLLVLGTYREIELESGSPLGQALADLRRDRAYERVRLYGLEARAVGALIGELAGAKPPADFADAVRDETEGNPFFVEEVLRHLAGMGALEPATGRWAEVPFPAAVGVPEGVGDVIGRRLARLGEDARATLQLGSVLGRTFTLAELEEFGDIRDDRLLEALEEATAAHAIAEAPDAPGRYGFAHALVRETLYRSLGSARRLRLHRRAAEALEAVYEGTIEAHLAQLAHHFVAGYEPGSDPAKAVDYSRRAGNRASALLSFEDAATHHERALQVLEQAGRGDSEDACNALLALADALDRAGQPHAARDAYRRAAELARRGGWAGRLGAAALGFARAWTQFDLSEAETVALLGEALEAVGPHGGGLRARLLARLGMELHKTDPAQAIPLAEEGVALAESGGDPATLAYCLNSHLWASIHSRLVPGAAQQLIDAAMAAADAELELQGRYWRVVELVELGRVGRLDEEIGSLVAFAERLRQPYYRSVVAGLPVMRALMSGDFDAAERQAHAGFEACRAVDNFNGLAASRFQLAVRAFLVGPTEADVEDFARWIDERLVPRGATDRAQTAWRTMMALLHAETGQHDAARATLAAVQATGALEPAARERRRGALPQVAEIAVRLGERAIAERLLAAARLHPPGEFLVSGRAAAFWGPTERSLGLLLLTLERFDEAVPLLETALARSEEIGAPPFVALGRLDLASALRGRGTDDDARRAAALFDQAAELASRLGMLGLAQRAGAVAAM